MLVISLLAAALPTALAVVVVPRTSHRMENLVTFGDSYTDEGRLNYFYDHHKAPPQGEMLPPSNHTNSGGYAWGRYVANMTGARYYDYAVAGAQCTNNIDSRYLDVINAPFPSVLEYEIPTFQKDLEYPNLYPNRGSSNTVYALWIGTNDLGIDGILGDAQKPGTTISTFVDCIWDVFDGIYKAGGRHFVLMNQAPLERAPMYATPGLGGRGNNRYRKNKALYNITEFAEKIKEYTTVVNTMFDLGSAFHLMVKRRWPGSTVSIFDIHSLMMDVIHDPGKYLEAPANVDQPYRTCLDGCVDSKEPLHSFMWFDELHPSERMEQIFAQNFIDVVDGRSKYATTYH